MSNRGDDLEYNIQLGGEIDSAHPNNWEIRSSPNLENYQWAGSYERNLSDSVTVLFENKPFEDMVSFLNNESRRREPGSYREVAAAICGDRYKTPDGRAHIHVTDVIPIPVELTTATGGSVTITQDAWGYINDVRERNLGGTPMVGWVHTHPAMGVFLSGMDEKIIEGHLDGQLSIVYDPIRANNNPATNDWQHFGLFEPLHFAPNRRSPRRLPGFYLARNTAQDRGDLEIENFSPPAPKHQQGEAGTHAEVASPAEKEHDWSTNPFGP